MKPLYICVPDTVEIETMLEMMEELNGMGYKGHIIQISGIPDTIFLNNKDVIGWDVIRDETFADIIVEIRETVTTHAS